MESPERPIFDSREEGNTPFETDKDAEALSDELKEAKAGEHHNSNLFDQNEDRAGEKTDLATGKPIDNSTDLGFEHLTIREGNPEESETEENDAAAQWLRENDPEKKKRY